MTTEEERQAFDAELEQNRVEVNNRRETVRAEHGQAVPPAHMKSLREAARKMREESL